MRNFHNVTVSGPFGSLKIVSKKDFLALIPTKEWFKDHISVEIYRSPFPKHLFFDAELDFPTIPAMIKTFFLEEKILSEDFYDYESREENAKYNLIEMIYDMTIKSANEMGNPTYLVRLSRRVWMAANPQDFVIFTNNLGSRLVNYRPKKTVCWKITK